MNTSTSSFDERKNDDDDNQIQKTDSKEEVGTKTAQSEGLTSRQPRPIKPLGTSRRPARSKTPTPNNPHPKSDQSWRTVSESSVVPPSRNTKQTSSADEKRPWFPFPSRTTKGDQNLRSSSATVNRSTSQSDRRTSNSSIASTSSASSYDSGDLNSYRYRRAISAEPEEWSRAISRGRPVRERVDDTSMADDQNHLSTPFERQEEEEEEEPHVYSNSSGSEEDQAKERAHFESVLKAFDTYSNYSLAANNARRRSFYALPRSHRLLFSSLGPTLPGPILEGENVVITGGRGFKARLDEIDDRIRRNADFLSQIVSDSRGFLGEAEELRRSEEEKMTKIDGSQKRPEAETITIAKGEQTESSSIRRGEKDHSNTSRSESSTSSSKGRGKEKKVSNHDVDKVRSTLKQFVRDWSEEGTSEREAAYNPILEALEKRFAHVPSAQRGQIRVLVPGAGLGRLAFEIAWQGFSCQGNEFSFFMLLASHFILNKTITTNQHVLYPFIHSSSNWRTATDMLRAIRIPDINPTDLPSHIDFSMVAGEFVEVYSKEQEKGSWHAITTCFFIDTARNFARYVEVINHILPIDGIWINIGPLLWHFEGATNGEISVELTLEEVLDLIELMGFVIEEQKTMKPQPYTGNAFSMLTYDYAPEFWIARKVRHVVPASAV